MKLSTINVYTKSFYRRLDNEINGNLSNNDLINKASNLYLDAINLLDDSEIIIFIENSLKDPEYSQLKYVLDKSSSHYILKRFGKKYLVRFYLDRLRVIIENGYKIDLTSNCKDQVVIEKWGFTGNDHHVSVNVQGNHFGLNPNDQTRYIIRDPGRIYHRQDDEYSISASMLDQLLMLMYQFVLDGDFKNALTVYNQIVLSGQVPIVRVESYRIEELKLILYEIQAMTSHNCSESDPDFFNTNINQALQNARDIVMSWEPAIKSRRLDLVRNMQDQYVVIRRPTTLISLPVGGKDLRHPFGLVGELINRVPDPQYYKLLSKSHNCVGSVATKLKHGLVECFGRVRIYKLTPFGKVARSAYVLEKYSNIAMQIRKLNLKYAILLDLVQDFDMSGDSTAINNDCNHLNYFDNRLEHLIQKYHRLQEDHPENYKDQLSLLIRITEFCYDNRNKFKTKESIERVKYALELVPEFYKQFDQEVQDSIAG